MPSDKLIQIVLKSRKYEKEGACEIGSLTVALCDFGALQQAPAERGQLLRVEGPSA